MDSHRAIRQDELLQQMGWVQALARSLVRDPDVAEDVAQQTWLTALERPPRTAHTGPSLRAWLAAVTRTAARQSVRSANRRTAREQRVAEAGPTEEAPALDVVAKGEIQRDLVDRVLELDEPYRSTVLLRYLDGLTGPEIAERTGVGHAAVRKRLSRGLAMLRVRLDTEHEGDCRPWLAAFLAPALPMPLPVPESPGGSRGTSSASRASPGATVPGGGLLSSSLGLFVGGAGLLLTGAILFATWWWESAPPAGVTAAPVTAIAPGPVLTAPTEIPLAPGAAPVDLLAEGGARGAGEAPVIGLAAVTSAVSGRVLDAAGAPLRDVRVRFEPLEAAAARGAATLTAFSDSDGHFVIDGVRRSGRVLVASSSWVTLLAGDASPPLDRASPIVVAAPRARLSGRVLGAAGEWVEGAKIEVLLPAGMFASLGVDLARSWPLTVGVPSDSEGRFEMTRVPLLPDASLAVTAPGYRPLRRAMPRDGEDLTLVLSRPAEHISGQVVDTNGRPVSRARVGFGERFLETDDRGAFTFWGEPQAFTGEGAPQRMVALAEGSQPALLDAPRGADGQPAWSRHVVLTLGPPLLTLRGEVVDEQGRPVPGALVWLADPTLVMAEAEGVEGSTERTGGTPQGGRPGPAVLVAEWLAIDADPFSWARVLSDADGHFEIEGLSARPYTVGAISRRSLVRAESAPTEPGDLARIVLPLADRVGEFTGRVVDRSGRPLVGARVQTRHDGARVAHTTWIVTGRTSETDAEGRFTLGATAMTGALIRVDGPGLIPVDLPVPAEAGDGEVQLVVPARRDLRVLLDDATLADHVTVEDAAGERLLLFDFRYDRRLSRIAAPLVQGRSEVLGVSELAKVLVLHRGEEPVRRVALRLLPGRVNEVR